MPSPPQDFGIRPEPIRVVGEAARWTGTVRHAEHLGSDTYLYVRTDTAGELTVRVAGEAHITIGERIDLATLLETLHRFDYSDLRL